MHKGEFDLIFAVDPAIGDSFRSFVSCVLQMIWVGSPKLIDPERLYTVDDLARMPIVTFPKGAPPYRQIAPYFQDEQVLASKLTSSNSMFAIINLIIDGFGVAAITAPTVSAQAASPADSQPRWAVMPASAAPAAASSRTGRSPSGATILSHSMAATAPTAIQSRAKGQPPHHKVSKATATMTSPDLTLRLNSLRAADAATGGVGPEVWPEGTSPDLASPDMGYS
jgi:DNA-binding transcriptional LysR family regulator